MTVDCACLFSYDPQPILKSVYYTFSYDICMLWGLYEVLKRILKWTSSAQMLAFNRTFRITVECACFLSYDPQTILKSVYYTICCRFRTSWGNPTWDFIILKEWVPHVMNSRILVRPSLPSLLPSFLYSFLLLTSSFLVQKNDPFWIIGEVSGKITDRIGVREFWFEGIRIIRDYEISIRINGGVLRESETDGPI